MSQVDSAIALEFEVQFHEKGFSFDNKKEVKP